MTYAIIKVAGKQYRVREGERLLVDRLQAEEGTTFSPPVLLVGGAGEPELAPAGTAVVARVLGPEKGPKIRIGKYRKRTGYRRHTGFRASLTRIEIESIGAGGAATEPARKRRRADAAEAAEPAVAETPTAEAAAGVPAGYAELTVAEIKKAARGWTAAELAAALAYEREHGRRKGALAALEAAAAEKEGES